MKTHDKYIWAAVLFVLLGLCLPPEARAYDPVSMRNTTPYTGYFRVLYAGCRHDDTQVNAATMVMGTILDKDKQKNPPPEVIEKARELNTSRDPFQRMIYQDFVKSSNNPYYFYQPQKPALVYQTSVSKVETARAGCLITTIRAMLYDNLNHKSVMVKDYGSTGTGFSNFVIQPTYGKTDEFEIVSIDKWWMPLVPVGECISYLFGAVSLTDFLGGVGVDEASKVSYGMREAVASGSCGY